MKKPNTFPLFIATRYLRQSGYRTSIATMIAICFLSIFLGSFALTLVGAVMNGIQTAVQKKIQSIHAPIMLASADELDRIALEQFFAAHYPEVTTVSPLLTNYALIQTADSQTSTQQPEVVMLRGIEPDKEEQASSIGQKIIKPGLKPSETRSLAPLLVKNQVLIGATLARMLDAQIGSTIDLYYLDAIKPGSRKATIHSASAVVGGIFSTGIDEFDAHTIFTTQAWLQTLFPDQLVTEAHLGLQTDVRAEDIVPRLRTDLGSEINVYSWKDLYPALVSAMALEHFAMLFVIGLISLVAIMNMIAVLFMLINQKRTDIALLKAMGASSGSINAIFVFVGMLLSVCATTTGIFAAWIASILLNWYPFITLPDVYYVSHLPATMSWRLAIGVFFVVISISFLAIWLPIRSTRRISIAQVLRFEA